VWGNGLMLYVVAAWLGKRLFRRGVERVLTGGSLLGSRVRASWLDAAIERSLFFLDAPTRFFIVKDFRTFRRDPAQWMQIFIFVGLLLFYFWGMRSFFQRDIASHFRNAISLLTLTATSLLMCAYTGRFIYPLLSLEGRTFWLLGLLPLDRSRLVWGKFAFSVCTCIVPCVVLMLTCDLMLGSRPVLVVSHLAAIGLVSIGLSGLSVSMGTFLPNFQESDPSKIAVGFGGTLNLVLGFFYLIVVIGLVALPIHVAAARSDFGTGPIGWLVWSLAGLGVLVGLAGAVVPVTLASRRLERMEF
jgi:ABC-2 type transport system permease protein